MKLGMAISEFEHYRYQRLLQEFCEKHGPQPHLHDKLQWGFAVDPKKQVVELFEIRPHFMKPTQKVQTPIAKARYVKAQRDWKIYWMRGNGKWTSYAPCPSVRTFEEFLALIREDTHYCFLG